MNPASLPFHFEIGPYQIRLPRHAEISAEVKKPPSYAVQTTTTHWQIELGRFRLFAHLDPLNGLGELKSFIDFSTKGNVTTPPIQVNGIDGVTHGDYGPPRTWIDWWFKKGDTMICLCLQSTSFPMTEPTKEEIAEHEAIVESLRNCRDSPNPEVPSASF